jgi:hypothetical protein
LYKAEEVKNFVAEKCTKYQRNGQADISHIHWDNIVKQIYNEKALSLGFNESEKNNYGTLDKRLTFEVIRSWSFISINQWLR